MRVKAYVEITNVCNLACAFCPGTKRSPRFMTPEEFALALDRLRGFVSYVYLHVMGEPLLHPALGELLSAADERKMKVCITTNGTLLPEALDTLLAAPCLHKLSVSLHSFEGNNGAASEELAYLQRVWDSANALARGGVICALRLWNEGGLDSRNESILGFLRRQTGRDDWPEPRRGSFLLGERLYLERDIKFDWPDLSAPETHTQYCRALRDQLGVLCDGTVVPCCLDHEGDLALGNLFEQTLPEILDTPRARALTEGFGRRRPAEELCRRCGYAERFNL